MIITEITNKSSDSKLFNMNVIKVRSNKNFTKEGWEQFNE